MKRAAVLAKLRREARARGLAFRAVELTRHTSITIGGSAHTLGRHQEIDDLTAHKFWNQYADVLGKDWWRE